MVIGMCGVGVEQGAHREMEDLGVKHETISCLVGISALLLQAGRSTLGC